jgi:transporter family-2 protein
VKAATAASVVAGVMLAGQARINGDLAQRLGHGARGAVSAAAVSFTVGPVALAVIVVATRAWRGASSSGVRAWWCLGGLGGALLVASSAEAAPLVGLALLAVAVVAGQTTGAMVVDRLGLGPAGHIPVTPRRIAGAGLATVGLVLAAAGRGGGPVHLGVLAVVALAGLAVAGQQAANGRLAGATGPLIAALVSFVGGTVVLVVLALALGGPGHLPGTWWLYLGGLGGATYVALAAAVVHSLGVLRVSLATTLGQLLGGVVLDAAGGVGAPSVLTLLGVTVTAVALLLTVSAGMSRPTRR